VNTTFTAVNAAKPASIKACTDDWPRA
jgi:hypothetical protein